MNQLIHQKYGSFEYFAVSLHLKIKLDWLNKDLNLSLGVSFHENQVREAVIAFLRLNTPTAGICLAKGGFSNFDKPQDNSMLTAHQQRIGSLKLDLKTAMTGP